MKNFKKVIGKANIALASLALVIGLVLPTQTAHASGYSKECIVDVSVGIVTEGAAGGLAGAKAGSFAGPQGATIGSIIGTTAGAIHGGHSQYKDSCR